MWPAPLRSSSQASYSIVNWLCHVKHEDKEDDNDMEAGGVQMSWKVAFGPGEIFRCPGKASRCPGKVFRNPGEVFKRSGVQLSCLGTRCTGLVSYFQVSKFPG